MRFELNLPVYTKLFTFSIQTALPEITQKFQSNVPMILLIALPLIALVSYLFVERRINKDLMDWGVSVSSHYIRYFPMNPLLDYREIPFSKIEKIETNFINRSFLIIRFKDQSRSLAIRVPKKYIDEVLDCVRERGVQVERQKWRGSIYGVRVGMNWKKYTLHCLRASVFLLPPLFIFDSSHADTFRHFSEVDRNVKAGQDYFIQGENQKALESFRMVLNGSTKPTIINNAAYSIVLLPGKTKEDLSLAWSALQKVEDQISEWPLSKKQIVLDTMACIQFDLGEVDSAKQLSMMSGRADHLKGFEASVPCSAEIKRGLASEAKPVAEATAEDLNKQPFFVKKTTLKVCPHSVDLLDGRVSVAKVWHGRKYENL